MKPRVFIGSSTEGLPQAQIVKHIISDIADCQIWNEDFFELSKSSFESLNEGSMLFDFGILLATKDDLQLKRDTLQVVARDNIVFEFGLYVGRLGRERAFLLKEKGLDIPSDLYGITVPEFASKSNSSIKTTCEKLKARIVELYQTYSLSFVPSTTLAIGYFENFIVHACRELMRMKKIEVNDKEYPDFKIHIVIPDELPDSFNDQVIEYLRRKKLNRMPIETNTRNYDFYLDYSTQSTDSLDLYDLPTTLGALKKAIEMAIPKSYVGETKRERILKQKEMRNFYSTLLYKINENPLTKNKVVVESVDVV